MLRPYLRDGLNLLAFKLTKTEMAGSIRPVFLTYDSDHPMIPIRPTAVAANDDMGILVWVLGASRAVPTNYKTLELNEAMIDWFNPTMSYNDVVIAAADEAGGQGFVTELANPTANRNFADIIYQERTRSRSSGARPTSQTPAALMVSVVQTFASSPAQAFGGPFGSRPRAGGWRWTAWPTCSARQLKLLAAGVTVDEVMARPAATSESSACRASSTARQGAPAETIDVTRFDRVAFLTDVEKLVIQPLEQTSAAVPRAALHDPPLHHHVRAGHDPGPGLRSQRHAARRGQQPHADDALPGSLPGRHHRPLGGHAAAGRWSTARATPGPTT